MVNRRLDPGQTSVRTTVWLLPDQIAWLKSQPGGLSVALRSAIKRAMKARKSPNTP